MKEPEDDQHWESLGAGSTVPMTPPGAVPPERPAAPQPGGVLGQVLAGRYMLRSVIGEGGMGKVYLGEDTRLNDRKVAVKLMSGHLRLDAEGRARFEREAHLQAKIRHPQIIQILDVGECSQGSYIVMEYSEGRNLHSMIKELGHFPMDKALTITEQLLEILDFAHRQDVVHRDLKPSNILIETRAGRPMVRVLDFGIAKALSKDPGADSSPALTQAGFIIGTPGYMAPEQATGETERVDHRADIYSAGVVLYHMLTGQLPCPKEVRRDVLRYALWITSNEITPPSQAFEGITVSQEIEDVLDRSLQAEPDKRFQSAFAFLEALRDARRYADVSTVRDTQAAALVREGVRRRRLMSRVGSLLGWVVLLASLGAAGFFWTQLQETQRDLKDALEGKDLVTKQQARTLVTRAETAERQAATVSGENEGLKTSLGESRSRVKQVEGEASELRENARSWESKYTDAELNRKALQTRNGLLEKQVGGLQKKLESRRQELDATSGKVANLERERDDLAREKARLEKLVREAPDDQSSVVKSLEKDLELKRRKITSLNGDLSAARQEQARLSGEVQRLIAGGAGAGAGTDLVIKCSSPLPIRVTAMRILIGNDEWRRPQKAALNLQAGRSASVSLPGGTQKVTIEWRRKGRRSNDWERMPDKTVSVSGASASVELR